MYGSSGEAQKKYDQGRIVCKAVERHEQNATTHGSEWESMTGKRVVSKE